MHEQAADALGMHCHYQLIEVAGAGREELRALLDGVRRLGFAGVNVTFPYKEAVVDLLDELSPGAAAVGAINAIVVRDGRLVGHNTDTTGFARAVRDLVTDSGHGTVAVIGAGGVGKAIACALAGLGVAEIRIFDTDRAKADHLAALLHAYNGIVVVDRVEDALRASSAWSTELRWECSRIGTRRSRMHSCTMGSGLPTPSIRRSGHRS